ncbi:Chromosome-associated kinesin kif4a [Balamuthia mandrillaris]
MMGTRHDPGLVPRAIQQLFTLVDQRPDTLFHIQCSFVELHMNQFMDLLDPDNDPRLRRKHLPGWKPRRIDIREDCSSGSVFLVGSETLQTVVTSYEEAIGLVERGHRTRTVASTCSNSKSSRSHAIITFQVESRDAANKEAAVTVGKLHMVDLAGSERLSKSLAEGETKKETMSINSSLTALGDVLSALSSQKGGLIPYRNNKLTRFLQDSLGGNSKTFFVINVQPAVSHWRETMMSLQYGQRAKLIRNCVSVNRDLVGSSDLQALNTEIENLKNRLAQRTQQYEEIRKQQSLVGRENKELKERLEALSRLNMEEKEALEHQMHAVIHSKEGEMAEQKHAFLSLQAYLDERVKKTHDLKVKLALEEGELEELRQKHKSQQHEITRLKAEKKVALQRNQKLLKKLETVRLLWEEDRNNIRTQVLNLETQLQQERMQILELRQQLDLAKNSKVAEKENEEEKDTTITEAELELKKQKRLAKDAQQKVRIVLSELEKQKNLTQEQDQLLEEQCARITELEKELKQRGAESKTDKRTIQQLQKEIELLQQQQSNQKSNGFEEEREEEETVVAKKRTSRKRRTIDEDDYVGEGEEKKGTKKKSNKTNATSGRARKRSKKQEQQEEQIEEEKEKEVEDAATTTTKKKQQRSNTSNGPKRLRGKRQLISETEFIDNEASLEPSNSSSSTQTQTNKPSPTNNTTNKKSFFASSASATRFGGLTTPSSSSASSSSAASVLMSGMMGPMTRALLKKRGSRPLSSVNSNKTGSLSGASSSISELVKVGQFRPPQLINNNNKLKEKENVF